MSANIENERIIGALACMDTLRKARSVTKGKGGDSIARSFEKLDAGIELVLGTAGNVSPRAAGVLRTLAEIVIDQFQNGCDIESTFDSTWTPTSTMTAEEVAFYRAEFAAESGETQAA